MNPDSSLAECREDLDAALLAYMAGDESKLDAYCKKWGVNYLPQTELGKRGGVMKAIVARPSLPRGIRRKAKRWLRKHGMSSQDDGDI